jgi:hypothetical protein
MPREPLPDETYVRAALAVQRIPVPEDEIANVATRFALLMAAFAEVEATLGARIDAEDPVPPVFPPEP